MVWLTCVIWNFCEQRYLPWNRYSICLIHLPWKITVFLDIYRGTFMCSIIFTLEDPLFILITLEKPCIPLYCSHCRLEYHCVPWNLLLKEPLDSMIFRLEQSSVSWDLPWKSHLFLDLYLGRALCSIRILLSSSATWPKNNNNKSPVTPANIVNIKKLCICLW